MDTLFLGALAGLVVILAVNVILSVLTMRQIRRKNRIIDELQDAIMERDATIEALSKRQTGG